MFALDRAKGTFACSCSYGTFAFHRANARVRLIALMLDSYFSFESAFAFFRANSRSGFIERIHARVLFRECTFAFHRATAHWRFIVWMHIRVLSREGTLTCLLNECTLSGFCARIIMCFELCECNLAFHQAKARVRSIDQRHIGIFIELMGV